MKNIIKIIFYFVFVLANSSFITAQYNCDYLILTPDCFLPQSTTWYTALINLQTSRGFHPAMEPIPDQTTIAEIQNIIADYYNNNSLNLKYVLLIGNSRHTQISPEVYFADSVFFPFYTVHCDAYWNTNGWDVVTDDPYTSNLTSRGPVYLGRVPVNSVTEINNYINKLQTYYQASVNYSLAKDREILLNLDVDFPNNGCRGSLVTTLNNNLINGHIPGNVSKAVLKVSEHTNGNDAFTYSAARDNLFISTLNSGASIMSILSTNWSRDTLGSWFNIHSAFSSLNNTVMPFLIGTSCNVGGVNDSNITDNCMRKLLVCPGGGIIGAVAPTSGTEQHINGDVLNLFHDLVFQTITPTYSEILPILKNYLATNDPYWSFYYKSFIFFGDPSMYPSIYKHITTDPLTATTWSGNIVLDGPITVSANLTIMPGTNIYFTEGAYLTIGDGTFTADATGGAPITIQTTGNSGSDNLIVFDGASTSNSVLKNVIIRNIGGIQCIDGANITIANDSLINTYDAITAYQCTPQVINNYISNPIFNGIRAISIGSYEYQMPISGNKVIISEVNNNSTTGICIENCNDPMVGSNHIKGFNYGLSIYGSCVFLIDSASMYDYRNNQIINNVNGLYVTGNSTLFAGYENGAFCNYNSIHDNTVYDLYLDNSWAEAYLNYWGDTHRINATNGDLDYDSGLSEDPWENQSFASIRPIKNTGPGIHLNKSMGSVDSNLTNSLSSGILLEKQGKINDAINYYKGLIQQNKNLHFAISELAKIKAKYTRNEISPYLEGLLANNLYYSAVEKLFGDMYLRSNQFDNAIAAYDNVIKNDSVGYDGINARFEKLYANLYIKKNLAAALKILSEIKGMNLTDIDNQMRIQNVERLIASANRRTVKKMSSNVSNIPQSYDLSQNYPNPFNPSTTINYQIPDAAKVSLIIYDILGRQIATLVDEYKSEGRYSVNFNASRFASGVYIYQLRANNFISSKKMLLLK